MPVHPLHAAINKLSRLSQAEFEQLYARCQPKQCAPKERLHQAGDRIHGVYFVTKGFFAAYRLHDGREIYQDFYFPGEFMTDISGLSTQQPSEVTLTALESSEAYFISRTDLLAMYELSNTFQTFGRLLLEQLLAHQTEMTMRQTTLTARERYDYVLTQQPELLQRVPLQCLSSYLGMTRETLSRVRRG